MFPTTPILNQTYNGYRWNGELWEVYSEPEAGQVIQIVSVENITEVTFSQNLGTYSPFIEASITPQSDSSYILIRAVMSLDANGGHYSAIHTRVERDSVLLVERLYHLYTGNTLYHRIGMFPELFKDTASLQKGTSYTYRILGTNATGSSASGTYAGRANSHNTSTLVLMEIKQ